MLEYIHSWLAPFSEQLQFCTCPSCSCRYSANALLPLAQFFGKAVSPAGSADILESRALVHTLCFLKSKKNRQTNWKILLSRRTTAMSKIRWIEQRTESFRLFKGAHVYTHYAVKCLEELLKMAISVTHTDQLVPLSFQECLPTLCRTLLLRIHPTRDVYLTLRNTCWCWRRRGQSKIEGG